MRNRKMRKGFTLIELLVVITILAVLATVSVIGYRSITKKTQISNDSVLIDQLNAILEANQVSKGKPKTPTEMLEVMNENGYNVEKLSPSTYRYSIVWNQEINEFSLLDEKYKLVYGQVEEKKYNTWLFLNDYPAGSDNKGYSVYLKGTTLSKELAITTGLDVGNNTNIPSISYSKASEVQKVTIRTSGSVLTINADTDTVHHYGWVKELKVEAVANSDCYHEHGFIGTLTSFTSGRFIAETGTKFHQTEAQVKDDTNAPLNGKECDLTKAKFGEHYYLESNCVMGDATESENKNGLVDGYFYKDNELFTGSENGYNFIDGKLIVSLSSKEYVKDSANPIVGSRIYNYEISNSEYLTKEIILESNNSSYDSSAKINITDNTGKNYSIKSVEAISPFDGLLETNNWSTSDIESKLMNNNGKALISNGYQIVDDINILSTYESDSDDPDNYDIFIPKLCADSDVVKAYLDLIECSTIQEYYEKYQNDSLPILLADYLKLLYGKGYTLINNNGTIEYTKTFGNNYQSSYYNDLYITITADSSTGLPQIQFMDKNNGSLMTAPTKDENGKLAFCDYVIDAAFNTKCKNGDNLSQLKWLSGGYYDFYVSISDNTLIIHEGSITGSEVSRYEIDNSNHVIKCYINGESTDSNGVPFSMPSSGTMTLVNGKVPLTGSFDVTNTSIPSSSLSGLIGSSNETYVMFEKELIEIVMKAAYSGTLTVKCNNGSIYNLNEIPVSVFSKAGNTWSTEFENVYSDSALNLLASNLFNGIDYAGTSYAISLIAE